EATPEIFRKEEGVSLKFRGNFKGVRAIGWVIKEYGLAQVSLNITDIQASPLHLVFEATRMKAEELGLKVLGSELIGLIPLSCMVEAGKYYQQLLGGPDNLTKHQLIEQAVQFLGLRHLNHFDPGEKILEYVLKEKGLLDEAHFQIEG
ncbi:MAG: hypothetical protein ACYCOO_11110, partial [Chitinophagaceae bacterium]